tara:strand:+ start:8387 stop:8641 length:255 start_codon:yes stop_codon:yes gene_type:complete
MPQQNDGIETKFMTSTKFAGEIEKLVVDNSDMNYIDAVVHFCELNSIEIETVGKLISKPLKEKLKFDAQRLNFIKKTSRAKLMF